MFFPCLILVFFQIILYSGDKIYDDYYQDLKGRVHFTSSDLKSGDASINVTNLRLSDIGTYQCKVKKAPGVGNKKIQLTVLGKLFVLMLLVTRVIQHGSIVAAFEVILMSSNNKTSTIFWIKNIRGDQLLCEIPKRV